MIAEFCAAIAFLTRLPIGRYFVFETNQVARAQRWFPAVGAMVGAISVAVLSVTSQIFPSIVIAVILAGINAAMTGALHLDGVADTADGFGGGSTPENVVRIMRDHTIGAYGAVALILVLGLRIGATATLIEARRAIPALILAPALGRWSAVLLSATQPYAKLAISSPDERCTRPIAPLVGRAELIIATVSALIIAVASDLWRGPTAMLVVLLASAYWAWRCRRRIGGITGDTLGANIEISECLVFLLFTGFH